MSRKKDSASRAGTHMYVIPMPAKILVKLKYPAMELGVRILKPTSNQ